VEKARAEKQKRLQTPPKVEAKPTRNLFGFESPTQEEASVEENKNERRKLKEARAAKEKVEETRSKPVSHSKPQEKAVEETGKPAQPTAAELVLSARESRSNSRAVVQEHVEEERLRARRAAKEQRRLEELAKAEKATPKKPSTTAPKSKLPAQVASKAQQPIQPAKVAKSKPVKEEKPQQVQGLALGFQSSRRGRPAKNKDEALTIKVSKTESKPESKKKIMAAEEQETIGFKVGTPLVPSTKKFSNPFGFTQDNEREEPANRVSVGKVNPFGGLGLVENHENGPEVRKGRGRPPKNTD